MGIFFHCKCYKNNLYSVRYKLGKYKYNIKKLQPKLYAHVNTL